MTVYQTWKRNEPTTISGESLTVTITYASFSKEEIDNIEKKMPRGTIIMDTDEPNRRSAIQLERERLENM